MKTFAALLLSMLVMLTNLSSAHALEVDNIRVGKHPDKTRIVFDLSEASDFRAFTLSDPYRIVVDLPTFSWSAAATSSKQAGISAIRNGKLSGNVSRIVLDLDQPAKLRTAFILPATDGKPARLVVDFNTASAAEFASTRGTILGKLNADLQPSAIPEKTQATAPKPPKTTTPQAAPQQQATFTPPKKPEPPAKAAPTRKPIVIIDPGHGGADPGAVSGNIHEKKIVLALGKQLKEELESTGKFVVLMTRTSDRFIRLHDRVKFARKNNADLFISLHADSIGKSSVRGASIYTLSENASDAQTAKLAVRENKADLIAGIDLSHEDEDVANILLDLTQRDTMNQSKFLAEKMVKAFKHNSHRTLENPHRYAGFAVLKAPDIPSILIEAGFVSNRQDARLLNQGEYRKKLARTIASGVELYFEHVQKAQRL